MIRDVDIEEANRLIKYVEIINIAINNYFKNSKEGETEGKSRQWKLLSNYSKRMENMILSDGLTKSLLFAFSKAKIANIDEVIKGFDNKSIEYENSDSFRWAIMIGILVCENFNRSTNILEVLKKLHDGGYGPIRVVESKLMLHLDILARLFESYSLEVKE